MFDGIFIFVFVCRIDPSRHFETFQTVSTNDELPFLHHLNHQCHRHVAISSTSSHGFVFHQIWIVKVCFLKALYNLFPGI